MAVNCAGKWLAVPARRVWGMPIQTKAVALPATCQQETALMHEDEKIKHSNETDERAGQCAIEIVEGLCEISCGHITESNDEVFRGAAVDTISSSGSRLEKQKRRLEAITKLNKSDSTATNGDYSLLGHATEVHRPRDAPKIVSPDITYAAFTERLRDHHGSPLDALSSLSLTNQRIEHPRSAPGAPVSPKGAALDFIKRRGSTSTRRPPRSNSISNNFRRLGIDVPSARSIKKTDLDSDSPDWACQTSLAIESGRISMDSVSKKSRESMRSKHIAKATHSTDERRNTYPLPRGDRSPTSPHFPRHSEGAPHALRLSAARKSARLVGMEIASPNKAPSKHDSVHVPPAIDLNKSLPPLPLRDIDDEGKEWEISA
ncbi:uncharacterized protein M421DRAFT_4424 [Didymella exigua CBS 183.55]|uniref:Uncharacterized protein n=1 Tax=Didymella exigua CBS 183.55 TaxID=1150837 RepID=A0A6A5RLF5_9PLEO|nr:uncharacterized protein M421DRAFT_4424 [Didymella exigua CBS 183.55]KAF1929261.1 hypothetical protein M421DRAFT_4424 [Didymella exigua CBS 183.55]